MYAIIGAVLLACLLLLAGLILRFRASLRQTLYSYGNAALAGLILFAAVMTADLLIQVLRVGTEMTPARVCAALAAFPRTFSVYGVALILLAALAVGVSNLALMRHEGRCLQNILGALLGGFFLVLTAAVYGLCAVLDRHLSGGGTAARLAGVWSEMFLTLMLSYFECAFIGICFMAWLSARHVPAYDKDFIIILGCSIDKRGGLLPLLKGRANRAVRFAWDQEIATGKPCRYVPSGGQGPNEIMSEGSAMEFYLLSHSAEPDEVFAEKRSRNTYENMVFSRQIIDALQPGAKVAYATTNYHIYRSGIIAEQAGLEAEGIASETKWYFWPNGFIREYFAILVMNRRFHAAAAAVCAALSAAVAAAGCLL